MITDDLNRVPSVFIVSLTLVMVGLFLFIALLNGQASLAILCVLVFSMAAGARVWSRISLSGIHYDLSFDKNRLFPGETLDLSVRLENKKFLPVWLQLQIAHGGSLKIDSGETVLKNDCGLLWYQAINFGWHLRAVRRGVHCIGPIELEVGDLLGFYPKKKKISRSHDFIVYPRRVALNSVPLPRRDFFGMPGAKSPIEDPVYIYGTRDYHHRSPARYIHWKASARHNRLQEKVCEPAEQEKVLMLVRTDRFETDPSGETFERCLEAAASLAMKFVRMRYALGLVTNGRINGDGRSFLPVSRNRNQIYEIMETMARLEAKPRGKLLDILQKGMALPWGVTCVCFQFEPDHESRELNQYFKNRNVPMVTIACGLSADFPEAETKDNGMILRLIDICAKGDRLE